MNDVYKTALDELECLGAVRRITAMPGWGSCFQGSNFTSDDNLIELVAKVSNLLRAKNISEAKASALIGCLYLTKRISDICARLRETSLGNPLELDLSVALKLPGEAANGLSFKLTGRDHQLDDADDLERLLAALGSILVDYPIGTSGFGEQASDSSLASLSVIYVTLLNVVQH